MSLYDHLEKGALLVNGDTDATLASIAISFKRIADNLDKLVTTERADVVGSIQDLAWEAGRSFSQGTRTDR